MQRNPALGIYIFSLSILFLVVDESSFARGSRHNEMRLLQFPTEYSVGTLGLLEKDPELSAKGKVQPIGEARGLMKVPRDRLVKMFPGVQFYQHPQCLLKLPPDGIDYINLRFTAMADADESISDRLIPYVHHLSGLKGIDLDKSETTDAGLAKLGTMPELRALALAETLVTGKCLGQLTGCKKLEALRFGKGTIDNESLRYLKEFPQLSNLELSRTNLSLRGLEHVTKCTKLRSLDINENSAINDKAVPLLLKLSKLEHLYIKHTKISFAGVMQLSKMNLSKISLPLQFSKYSKAEQEQIKKHFPYFTTKRPKEAVDSYTKTMFGPLSR
ncbi:MAG: hypothetical protein Q8T09_08585 [Candidatus Melainabacteria bacterium]|nr:hypothetical protein [Candidatus Melainabacteria bacterium]